MSKKILVQTDDPDNSKLYLQISGKVKEIVRITPPTLSLSGIPGQTLSDVVTIESMDGEQLNILDMKLKFNEQIKAELIKPGEGEKIWQVRISCYCDHAADLYDFITLHTDNPYKPRLKIRVYAMFEPKTSPGEIGSQIPENKGGNPKE